MISLLPAEARPTDDSEWNEEVESYTCHACATAIQVWIRRRTFYVVKAQNPVPLHPETNKPLRTCMMNCKGGMSVGWKDSIAISWAVAVAVAGGLMEEADDANGTLMDEDAADEDAEEEAAEDIS